MNTSAAYHTFCTVVCKYGVRWYCSQRFNIDITDSGTIATRRHPSPLSMTARQMPIILRMLQPVYNLFSAPCNM